MITKLIVGLGNPNDRYKLTRHNIGYDMVDCYATHYGFFNSVCRTNKNESIKIKTGKIKNTNIIILKPYEGMNISGNMVGKLVKSLDINNEDIVVIHDDLDLEFGRIKFKASGGSGGHNGLKSIIDNIGKNFCRYRIGIGRPIDQTPIDYVLSNFTAHERATFCSLSQLTIDIIDTFIEYGADKTMNKYNKRGVEDE